MYSIPSEMIEPFAASFLARLTMNVIDAAENMGPHLARLATMSIFGSTGLMVSRKFLMQQKGRCIFT